MGYLLTDCGQIDGNYIAFHAANFLSTMLEGDNHPGGYNRSFRDRHFIGGNAVIRKNCLRSLNLIAVAP